MEAAWFKSLARKLGYKASPDELDPEDLGLIAVQLALHFAVWVRRRRYIVSYVDDTTIRQRMTVDFELPEPGWFWSTRPPDPDCTIYVPLHIAVKETLDQFSVFDEDGRRLTMLATAENGAMAVLGLLPPIHELATRAGVPLTSEDLKAMLEEIVMASRTPSFDPVKEVFDKKMGGELGGILKADDENKAIVRDLAGGFLMLVPVRYQPGSERLIKAEWNGPNLWHGRRETYWRYRLRRRRQSLLASIAWGDKLQSIPDLQIGWARSTHVEVVVPPDVRLTSASLDVLQYDRGADNRVLVESLKTVYNKPRATMNITPRIPYDPYADSDSREEAATKILQCRGDEASVQLRFHSPPSGVLIAAATASAMLTALLWVASEHLASIDRQTFSAVLLIFPAIVAVYLLRPGEHDFARRLLTGVRLCGLGTAACSIAVAALLGVASLTRVVPAGLGVPVASVEPPNCGAASAGPDTRVHRRAGVVPCTRTHFPQSTLEPNPPVQLSTRILAAAATALSAVLLVGFLRTWLCSDLRHRQREEELKKFPEAVA